MDRYLQDEDAVVKLVYLTPSHRQGLGVIAEGLFSNVQEVAVLTARILSKVQRSEVGLLALKQSLTLFHELKLSELQAKALNY
mmetsp:Transcript_26375/g.40269  ORF Transcript_26375/g.40269 Transcript_26375/m.40269 type:complete len:83 (+) Transcript_26375:438-686(+)